MFTFPILPSVRLLAVVTPLQQPRPQYEKLDNHVVYGLI